MRFSTIVSGSSGNCVYIEAGDTRILVDAGCSNRCLVQSLASFGTSPSEISAIFISHEHRDHISGALRISKRFDIPLYASAETWRSLPFCNDYFDWQQHIFEYGMKIGEMEIDFFRLSHDAVQPVGFVFSHQQTKVGVATDTGTITPSMAKKLANIDGLVFEANHDLSMLMKGPYPYFLKQRVNSEKGHLSNRQAGLALAELCGERTKAILLAHLSDTNNHPDLALQQVGELLSANPECEHIELFVAPRYLPHPIIEV